MRVDRVRLVRVPLVMVDPLVTSDGSHQSRDAVLMEITDSDGFIGWGENVAPSGVTYTGESAVESLAAMRDLLVPCLIDRDVAVGEMYSASWWGVDGWNMAKHALESAMWDIHARRQGESLAYVLGGDDELPLEVGVVVGLGSDVETVCAEVHRRVIEGYQRVKVKIAPGRDIDVVAAVRALVGDDFALQVDANCSYDASQIDRLVELDRFGLQFIEQPFAAHDLEAHRRLAARSTTSVCLDESIMNMDELVAAVETGACDVVNIKPSRVGGIRDAVAMHDYLVNHEVDAWVGGMLESGIGRASCLALASLPGFTLTPDLSASNRYFESDITEPFVLDEGCLSLPSGDGIGVTPLDSVLNDPRTRIETLFER